MQRPQQWTYGKGEIDRHPDDSSNCLTKGGANALRGVPKALADDSQHASAAHLVTEQRVDAADLFSRAMPN